VTGPGHTWSATLTVDLAPGATLSGVVSLFNVDPPDERVEVEVRLVPGVSGAAAAEARAREAGC